MNPDTGFFADTSQSYWSDAVDGNAVQSGGAANELPVYTARNLYTDSNGSHLNITATPSPSPIRAHRG